MGALGSGRGGGWEIKHARCRKMEVRRCRKNDAFVKGGVQRLEVYGRRSTDLLSRSYDHALAQQPGILLSVHARGAVPIRPTPLLSLAQLATGCSNPLSNLSTAACTATRTLDLTVNIFTRRRVILKVRMRVIDTGWCSGSKSKHLRSSCAYHEATVFMVQDETLVRL